jgi:ribosomal protein L11 methyltransferase
MGWVQLSLVAPAGQAARLEEALEAAGALSVTLDDSQDVPILEPGVGETPLWPEVRITGLFEEDCDRHGVRQTLANMIADELPELIWRALEDRVWEREWLQHFKPLRFGERLWVCPGDAEAPADDAVVLRLDPGLAFGTGTHPTTAMCLDWLAHNPPRELRVVDYGCGSGILAVGAVLLGASHALAVDIDPQALTAARENARRNGVPASRLATGTPDALTGTTAVDVVIANILAGPLIELAPRLASLVREGGSAVLSGVLSAQAAVLEHAYAPWFTLRAAETREEWCLLWLCRNTAASPRPE